MFATPIFAAINQSMELYAIVTLVASLCTGALSWMNLTMMQASTVHIRPSLRQIKGLAFSIVLSLLYWLKRSYTLGDN